MPTLGAPLDFAKLEGRNFVGHLLGTAPSSPVKGQMYMNTADNTLYWYDGTTWQSAKGGSGSPTGAAGGDLSGTYPNPQIAAGVIVDADVAAANKDGTAGTPSLRTLGTGATQAAAGNDSRLSDARAPTSHKTTHEPGGSDPMTVDAAAGTGSLRTLGAGPQQALPGNSALNTLPCTNDVLMSNHKIYNLADPTNPQDAATKTYVDSIAQGLDAKASVRVRDTGVNIALAAAPNTLDGVTLVQGDRVLVGSQATPAQNGIYVVTTLGTGANGVWTRATDMDAWAEVPNAYTWVEEGTNFADTGWVCVANQTGTLGTTSINFVLFASAGALIAGAGLVKSGNSIDVGAGTGISVAADTIAVDSAIIPRYYSSATHGAGATITITQATHGCRASRGLVVMTVVEATGAEVLADVSIAANGDVTITFGASQSANTIRVTIIG